MRFLSPPVLPGDVFSGPAGPQSSGAAIVVLLWGLRLSAPDTIAVAGAGASGCFIAPAPSCSAPPPTSVGNLGGELLTRRGRQRGQPIPELEARHRRMPSRSFFYLSFPGLLEGLFADAGRFWSRSETFQARFHFPAKAPSCSLKQRRDFHRDGEGERSSDGWRQRKVWR